MKVIPHMLVHTAVPALTKEVTAICRSPAFFVLVFIDVPQALLTQHWPSCLAALAFTCVAWFTSTNCAALMHFCVQVANHFLHRPMPTWMLIECKVLRLANRKVLQEAFVFLLLWLTDWVWFLFYTGSHSLWEFEVLEVLKCQTSEFFTERNKIEVMSFRLTLQAFIRIICEC